MKKGKKLLASLLFSAILMEAGVFAEYEWAKDAVTFCVENKILHGMEDGNLALGDNLTREQMAKIMVDSFGLVSEEESGFSDVFTDRWSYMYIRSFSNYMKKKSKDFRPTEKVTREEFVSSLVLSSGLNEGNLRNPNILAFNFDDSGEIDKDYRKLVFTGKRLNEKNASFKTTLCNASS